MNLIEAYSDFLWDDAKDDKTIQSYRYAAQDFCEWLSGSDQLTDVRPVHVKEYIAYLRHEKRLSPATVNKYIAGLNSFFSFAVETGAVSLNPMKRVRRVTVADSDGGRVKWLSPSEQERFLSYVELETSEWLRTRNLAAIDLMLYAGLRVQEVSDLMIDDISASGKDLKIIVRDGKRGKFATVTLVQKYARNLKKWQRLRKDADKAEHTQSDRLFVSERSGQLNPRGIQKFIAKYAGLAGIAGVTPHRFRHSFCKNLARQDTPIEIIKRLARHESISTTAIYVDPSSDEMIQSLRKM